MIDTKTKPGRDSVNALLAENARLKTICDKLMKMNAADWQDSLTTAAAKANARKLLEEASTETCDQLVRQSGLAPLDRAKGAQ